MKKNTIPDKKSAPANKAAIKNSKRNMRKEAEARSRARRTRSLLKLGLDQKDIEKIFEQEDNRFVLVLFYGSYTLEDGTKIKKVWNKALKKKEEKEVPNILHGSQAAMKYIENNKLNVMASSTNSAWILTDKDNVDSVSELLKVVGRISITKPEKRTYETEKARLEKEKETPKTHSNNTKEVAKAAKATRKASNIERHNIRAYYAALRKGGVSSRIKKYNKPLADKIEEWLKEHKKIEDARAEKLKEHNKKHRQTPNAVKKANKKARRVAKMIAAKERKLAIDKARAAKNAAKKPNEPVQTQLKLAA